MRIEKKFLIYFIAVMLLLAGCGNSSTALDAGDRLVGSNGAQDRMYVQEAPEEMAMAEFDEGYDESAAGSDGLTGDTSQVSIGESSAAGDRKLIRNVSINAETLEYEKVLASVQAKTVELGGYIENISSSVYSWETPQTHHASLTLRVPAQRADELIELVAEDSNVTDRSENTEDVTLSYVDIESHKKALETEQKRLLEILEEAESVEDIISIESRLSEVRYQIESMESQLRSYDNKINYTTVRLELSEVARLTPVEEPGFFEKIGKGFTDSLQGVGEGLLDFISWLIINSPYIVVWLLILFLLVRFVIIGLIRRLTLPKDIREELKKRKRDQKERKKALKGKNKPGENMAENKEEDKEENKEENKEEK